MRAKTNARAHTHTLIEKCIRLHPNHCDVSACCYETCITFPKHVNSVDRTPLVSSDRFQTSYPSWSLLHGVYGNVWKVWRSVWHDPNSNTWRTDAGNNGCVDEHVCTYNAGNNGCVDEHVCTYNAGNNGCVDEHVCTYNAGNNGCVDEHVCTYNAGNNGCVDEHVCTYNANSHTLLTTSDKIIMV